MNCYFRYIVFLLAFCNTGVSVAQQLHADTVVRRFQAYRVASMQEKLFVHVDQDFHLTGEILWFRVFNVDGTLHNVSTTSKVAFVELLDTNSQPVIQTKVPLDENGGQGSIFIPATLSSGNYVLRVYTQWMRNFSPDYYFQKKISIVNPFVRPETIVAEQSKKVTLELFPEGGNLVEGVRTKIGFKASVNGEGAGGEGWIIRNNADTVAKFSPAQFGLGSFFLTVSSDDEYKAFFKAEGTSAQVFPMPKIYNEGYTMHASDSTTDLLKVRVRFYGKTQSLRYAYLFAHARQSIVFSESKAIYPKEAVFTLNKKSLPGGITHLTLFDSELNPVCERLWFKRPEALLSINMTSDQRSYSSRRKVSLSMTTAAEGKSVPANISLSVYKLDSLSSENQDDFLAYLYLQSDLTGTIESPSYYMSDHPDAARAADDLMLTHGWRRFKWENVLARKNDVPLVPEVRSHLITGKVMKQDGTPVQGVLAYLSSPGKLVNIYGARSNKDGLVHFEVRDFWGTRQLIMQTNTSLDSSLVLAINNPYDESKIAPISPLTVTTEMKDQLSERSLSMQVQDIYFRELNDRIVAFKNDSTGFYGHSDETYNLDDYTRFPVMEEVMREYVPGVLVRKRRDGFYFVVLDRVNKGVLRGDPLVLLDGMPVFDIDRIMAFDPLKVKKLDVVTRNYYLGPHLFPGIVSYSTYTGDLAGFALDPRSVSINYEGLQAQREFYTPSYETQKQRSNRMPDQRTLLHWEPVVKTTASGSKTITFYTSDNTGNFIVVAHGLAHGGKAGSAIYKFAVRPTEF